MKRKVAFLVTLVALLAIVKFGQHRPATNLPNDEQPMACVDRMFTAASRGDVAAYVDCFSGLELQAIQRSLGQESKVAASDSLRKTMSDLRGWAVVDPPPDTPNSFQCSVVVERIYSGRIDRLRLDMLRIMGFWKICRVEPTQSSQPPVAYGTPIMGTELPDQSTTQTEG